MSDRDAVLFANEAFYQAFADRDVAAMDQAWAEKTTVVCIHPGWPPVDGREEVMRTWAAILSNEESPRIQCHAPEAYIQGDLAFVVCYEEIEGQYLVATNIFVREGRPWRMVHHHAGPTSGAPPADEEEDDAPRTVN